MGAKSSEVVAIIGPSPVKIIHNELVNRNYMVNLEILFTPTNTAFIAIASKDVFADILFGYKRGAATTKYDKLLSFRKSIPVQPSPGFIVWIPFRENQVLQIAHSYSAGMY